MINSISRPLEHFKLNIAYFTDSIKIYQGTANEMAMNRYQQQQNATNQQQLQ
jgi:hypothetical protein